MNLPGLDQVARAARAIAPHVHRTPVFTFRSLDELCGFRVILKAENLQRGGSFKVRGSTHAVLGLSREERACGIVSYSSGNHAQGVALAARTVGTTAVIVMPDDAPEPKRSAVLAYGGRIQAYDRRTGVREEIAREIAARTGRILIPPFDDDRIIAGQGTMALELAEQAPALDALLVPVGGGGLISGCAIVAKEAWPGCRVLGVEPEAADDARRSLEEGRIVSIDEPETIADGLRPRSLGQRTFAVMSRKVDGILTVSDAEIARAVLFLFERAKLVVEPSGAVGVAALLSEKVSLERGRTIGVILSGGNLDPALLPRIHSLAGERNDPDATEIDA